VDIETERNYKDLLRGIIDFVCVQSGKKKLNPQYEKIDVILDLYKKYEAIMQRDTEEKDVLEEHHKIAAGFCCSILKARPINPILDSSGVDLKPEEIYANEYCAFLFGVLVIQISWIAKSEENISEEEKRIYGNEILIPQPQDDHTTYTDWFIKLVNKKALDHFDCENKKLFEKTMLYFLAHIFFGIDSYSYQFYKNL